MEQVLINLVAGALGGVGAGKSSPTFDLGTNVQLVMTIVIGLTRARGGMAFCRVVNGSYFGSTPENFGTYPRAPSDRPLVGNAIDHTFLTPWQNRFGSRNDHRTEK